MESIKIKLLPGAKKPKRATDDAIGYDVFAYQVNKERKGYPLPYILNPRQRVLIGVGFFIKVPEKTDCQVRPRSGLSIKYGIQVLNGPGTLDPDYMGEAGVILHNTSNKPFEIKKDMRIAQLIFSKVELPVLLEVDSISKKTRRGEGGFGSTGVYDIEIGTTEYDREVKKQDIFFMRMAVAASYRSNCVRGCKKENGKYCRDEKGFLINQKRKFGCVIVKNDTVVSYGYNAQARGQPLCEEVGCLRDEKNIPSGTQIEVCRAVHAEQMAFNKMLIAGVGSSTKGVIVYVTAEPCDICAKMLADSGIETLVVLKDVYPQNGINIIKTAGINIRFVEEGNIKW